MKLIPTSLLGSAIFLSAVVQAQSAYDSACDPVPSGETEIKPGFFATYGCGKSHVTTGYSQESKNAATPKDCARECSKRPSGGPCTWFDTGVCYFYDLGTTTVTYTNGVTVDSTRKDWDRLEAAYDTCITSLSTCGTGGPPGHGTGGPPGHGTGGPPRGPPSGTVPLTAASCPGSGGARIWHGGQTWQLICGKFPSPYPTGGKAQSVTTLDQCIDICAADTNCKWSNWDRKSGCYTYNNNNKPADFNTNSSWDVYIKV